jgi:hypothetical protein
MQFHIDGRFQADIRFENNAWTVHPAQAGAHPAPPAPGALDGLADDDIASFLDDIFLEAGQEHRGQAR